MPLTADRAKPAVPFGGIYRLIDFALSNVVNSGYLKIVVLTQYKSHSLDRHVTKTWRMSTMLGNYVAPIPAQQRVDKSWYQGSADAIFQSLNTITDERPDIVVVVGADHVYRMDFSQMVDQHVESGAGRHRRRDPAADRDGRPVRRHRGRGRRPHQDQGVPREADRPRRPARLPRRDPRVDGQLRLRRRRPPGRGDARLRGSRTAPTTWAATSCPALGQGRLRLHLRLQEERHPRRHRARPGLLARRRDARLVLRRPHGPHLDPPGLQPLQLRLAALHELRALPAGEVRPRRVRPVRRGAQLDGLARRHHQRRPGQRTRWSPPTCDVHSYSEVDDSVLLDGVDIGRNCRVKRAIIDKNVQPAREHLDRLRRRAGPGPRASPSPRAASRWSARARSSTP